MSGGAHTVPEREGRAVRRPGNLSRSGPCRRRVGMEQDLDVIVVGAGLAGLAAGATAAAAGVSAVVLDAHQRGGRARTTARDGYLLNMGPHALYAGGAGIRVLRSLGVEPKGQKPPLSRYRLLSGGRTHLMPTSPSTLLRCSALTSRSKAQLGRLLTALRRVHATGLANLAVKEWLSGYDLRPDALAVALAVIRLSTYVADIEEFSADAAVRQLQLAAGPGVLYIDGGWSSLVDKLAAGVEVRSHHRVVDVAPTSHGVELDVCIEGGDHVTMRSRAVILALGSPQATQTLLRDSSSPAWHQLGEPVTGACLDIATTKPPSPGYVLGVDDPIYGTTQGPPARLAPDGAAVVSIIRYGARSAAQDRADLEQVRGALGITDEDVVFERFLARTVIASAMPRAETGGVAGRPGVNSSGVPGVLVAGDWVGAEGLLADASLASGQAAAKSALGSFERGYRAPAA